MMMGAAERTAAGDRRGSQPAGAFQTCNARFGEPGAPTAFLGSPAAVAASDPHAVLFEVGAQRAGRQACELFDEVDDTLICRGPPVAIEMVKDNSADIALLALVSVG
jgi:hypothetical protein